MSVIESMRRAWDDLWDLFAFDLGHDLDTPVAEPPLSADELVAVRGLIQERYDRKSPAAEDEPPTNYLTPQCACGAEYATRAECPWCQTVEDVLAGEPSSRAVGIQHAAAPGEVSSDPPRDALPGGQDIPTSVLLRRAARALEAAGGAVMLRQQLHDRGAQFEAIED